MPMSTYEILTLIISGASIMVGILASNSMTLYRIKQIEVKLDTLVKLPERTTVLENDVKYVWCEIKDIKQLIK